MSKRATENPLEKGLNRLLWKMRKPYGCESIGDVALWLCAEMKEIGIVVNWNSEELTLTVATESIEPESTFTEPIGRVDRDGEPIQL